MSGTGKTKKNKTGKLRPFDEDLSQVESGFTSEIKLKSIEAQEEAENLKLQVGAIQDKAAGDSSVISNEQMEVLNRYIALKEAEVNDLREQHKQSQAWVSKTAEKLEKFNRRNLELAEELESAKASLKHVESVFREEKKKLIAEHVREKADLEERIRISGATQAEFHDLLRKKEEFKEKVREDLKRIKLKERELENKYELLRRDTGTLIESKDRHLLELKKKNDALDLELESLEERLRNASAALNGVSAKKRRLIETLKLAISLLDEIDKDAPVEDNIEKKAG